MKKTAITTMAFISILALMFLTPMSLIGGDKKPKVLIIGDSISLGYTPYVIEMLKDKADVEHNKDPNNAAAARGGLKHLDGWLKGKKYDVIHCNWGLWDINRRVNGKRNNKGKIATSPEAFEKRLTKIIKRLKKTKAKLIFANITHVTGGWGRRKGDDVEYNKIIEKVMKANDVEINDLNKLTAAFSSKLYKSKGNVHFTAEGYKKIAKQVSDRIEQAIETLPKK